VKALVRFIRSPATLFPPYPSYFRDVRLPDGYPSDLLNCAQRPLIRISIRKRICVGLLLTAGIFLRREGIGVRRLSSTPPFPPTFFYIESLSITLTLFAQRTFFFNVLKTSSHLYSGVSRDLRAPAASSGLRYRPWCTLLVLPFSSGRTTFFFREQLQSFFPLHCPPQRPCAPVVPAFSLPERRAPSRTCSTPPADTRVRGALAPIPGSPICFSLLFV